MPIEIEVSIRKSWRKCRTAKTLGQFVAGVVTAWVPYDSLRLSMQALCVSGNNQALCPSSREFKLGSSNLMVLEAVGGTLPACIVSIFAASRVR